MAAAPPPETPEMRAVRVREGERAHDHSAQDQRALLSSVITFGAEALKAAALVNGGSGAAMLAFIGTGRQAVTADSIFGLKLFGIGLAIATTATGLAYLSQLFFAAGQASVAWAWDPPFVVGNRRQRFYLRAGTVLQIFTIIIVLVAYGCAAAGLVTVAGTLAPMPAR